ncbi:conjugal transfer protein TrbE (plasmid) [Methylocaldum gracile subsp. desertum]|uniref:TraG/VirB4 family ATPase n=1 Tax=Methylocaldum sp. GT1BW TaxID=3438964 RepID=UPI003DA025DB
MIPTKEFRTAIRGLPDLLQWGAIVSDQHIILNKNGSLMAGFFFSGPDMASSTPSELDALSAQLNAALIKLGNGWMFHIDSFRKPSTHYIRREECHFPDPVTSLIDEERRAKHDTEGAHYENNYALVLTYLPPADIQQKLIYLFLDDDGKETRKGGIDLSRLVALYAASIKEIEGALSACLKILRMNSEDLLSYLHFTLTGLRHKVALPSIPMYLDTVLGSKDFYTGMSPRIGQMHIRCITITGFPSSSYPGILDGLNHVSCVYRWSSRFIPFEQRDAENILGVFRRNWFQKRHGLLGLLKNAMGMGDQTFQNSDAIRMAADADESVSQASEGLVRFGYYTSVVVLMDDDLRRLEENANEMVKRLGNLGFPSQVETINAVEAFIGSLPGHGYENVRRPLIHTKNLADLMPSTSVWAGLERNPCPFYPPNSPPLFYAATTGSTPFRVGLHVGDVGHALVLGPTGAGKSTLLGLVQAQQFRYPNAQVFTFDKGKSSYLLAKAAQGNHYDIGGDQTQLAFCPLGALDDDSDKAWAKEYIELLVQLQMKEGDTLTPGQRIEIHNAIELMAGNTHESRHRTLTNLKNTIQSNPLREALSYYTVDGSLGHLLDAEEDSLRVSRFMVFEMEDVMSMGERALIPILMYLFRRIEKRLNGAPTLIVLDEAWVMLRHPLFREKIREWLKVMRKANAAVVFATQSLSDVMNSPIADVILESTPTKILLPNPEAANQSVAPLYRAIGLNDTQITLLSRAIKQREYYLLSSQGRRMFNLGLGPVALSFVGASGKEDIARVNALMKEFPNEWVERWLAYRGVSKRAIDEYLSIRDLLLNQHKQVA